jgi:hypothetical protein
VPEARQETEMSDWIKTAKVGDKVVCVDDAPHAPHTVSGYTVLPEKGRVYTIRGIVVGHQWLINYGDGVFLNEIVRPSGGRTGVEQPWNVTRFRPVQPRKTDISVFTALLKSTPTHKPVRETEPC